jgi:hypothetical protein
MLLFIAATKSCGDCAHFMVAGDDVTVDAERNMTGALGKGNVDYTIQYDGFSIVVLEVSQMIGTHIVCICPW